MAITQAVCASFKQQLLDGVHDLDTGGNVFKLALYTSAATIPNKQTATYLSTKAPELLFYAVMVNAYGFLKGPMDMYKLYKDKYNSEIQAFALEQTGRRRRGEYTDGTLRIPIASPSPEQWRNLK